MARIFISYSRTDEEFARRLASDLDGLRGDAWIDVDDIHPTEDWADTIHRGLNESQLMIVVVSPASMQSENVSQEWKYFHKRKKTILPVLLEPAEVHFQLENLQYVDFCSQDYDTAFSQLHSELRRQGIPLEPLSARDPSVQIPAQPSLRTRGRESHSRRVYWVIGMVAVLVLIGIAALLLLNPDNHKGSETTATTATQAAVLEPTEDALNLLLEQYTQTVSARQTETTIPTEMPNQTATQQYWETQAAETVVAGWTQKPMRTPTPTTEPTDSPEPTATPEPTDTSTNTPTDTPTIRPTNTLTDTPEPTRTLTPTVTPKPTDTPTNTPTITPTPTLEPTRAFTPTVTLDPAMMAFIPTATLAPTDIPAGSINAQLWPEPTIQAFDGVDMVYVPAGCFVMGSNDGEDDEKPPHEVCLDAFWIDRTEVTNGQFASLNGQAANASYFSGNNRPREQITWFEARDFCVSREARLPTEAEWEYAARGPEGLMFPWGDEWDPSQVISNTEQTVDVGSKLGGASWVGVLDMSGNVWEWVADRYDTSYYATLTEDTRNPAGPSDGNSRVVRGGSFYIYYGGFCMWCRDGDYPLHWVSTNGFRCARSANP